MTDRFRPHDLSNSVSEPGGHDRAGRWAAIGRIVLFTLLTVFFLLAGLALVFQPALRWGGLVLVTLALVCASFGLLGIVELRGKRLKSGGGPRMARWILGIASVVVASLATVSALALGSGDRSVYMLIMLIAGTGGFAYLVFAWWRFERAQRAKRQSAE